METEYERGMVWNMKWQIDRNKETYILRYYLPCEPICREDTTFARMEALISYCIQYRITAVMLYVDLNPYWYYMPDDIEHVKYYSKIVKVLAEKMRGQGISYQLNYQNLFGSWDGGADLQEAYNWENYVDELGIASRGCACSIGERFRETAGAKLRIWAETKPDVIWIDDDIRFHNHRTSIEDWWSGKIPSERTDFGCFCDRHIRLFNEKHHWAYTRDQIVRGILNGNGKNGMRRAWLDFSGECAEEVAEWIEQTIHEASPETRIAIMTSSPDAHSVEGRHWGGFLEKLSGGDTPLLRPTFGPYAEKEPRDFLDSYLVVEQLKANIRSQYPEGFDFCPEIENTRFTRWSKSVAATGYQIMLSAFLGCRGVTLSIFDLEGCVLAEEPEYGQLLQSRRNFADRMAGWDLWEWESQGVGLVTAPERIAAQCNARQAAQMHQLASGRLWDKGLTKAGIPCRYITPDQAGRWKCAALDGYTANLLQDAEIEKLLSGGLLLDAGAAEVLNRRGFSEGIGVGVGEEGSCITASEILHRLRRSDGSEVRVPSRIDGGKWSRLIPEGAETISSLVTPYGTEYPGFTFYENGLGGRICVYAGKGSLGDGFYSNYRVRMLKDICRELSGERLFEMNNASYALMAVKRRKEEYAVFIANMSADEMRDIVIRAPRRVREAAVIDAEGTEYPAQIEGDRISCGAAALPLYGALVCRIRLEESRE